MKTTIKSFATWAMCGAVGLVAFAARADTASGFFSIDYIEAGMAPEDGIAIRPVSTFTPPNPHGCQDVGGYIFANTTRTAAEKSEMNKLVNAAFLAGKKISLIIDSTRCTSGTGTAGAPVYNYVTLRTSQ